MNRHERRKAKQAKSAEVMVTSAASPLNQMDQASLLKLQEAVLVHKNGDVDLASKTYHRLLKKFPNNPECLNFLGIAALSKGNAEEAEKLLRQAIEQEPSGNYFKNLASALNHQHKYEEAIGTFVQYLEQSQGDAQDYMFMGSLLHRKGEYDEALTYMHKSLALSPDNVQSLSNLAAAYLDIGNLVDAKVTIEKALKIEPDNSYCLTNYGVYYATIGETDKAMELYRRALAIAPDNVGATQNLADIAPDDLLEEDLATLIEALPKSAERLQTLKSIANITKKLGRPLEALDYLQQAMELAPEDPYAFTIFAECLKMLHRPEEAVPYVEAALRLDPLFCNAYICYGEINKELFDYEFSAACFAQALTLKPGNPQITSNLGVILYDLGLPERSEEAFKSILEINPNFAAAHYNYSFSLMSQCRLKEAWEEYHWRYKHQAFWAFTPVRHFTQPEWEGTPLQGKSILAYSEQGIGDHIVQATLLPDLIQAGGKVTLEIEPRLVSLYQRSYPEIDVIAAYLTPEGATQAGFDYQIAIPDLCRFYRNDIADFPSDPRTLVVDADEASVWKKRFAEISDRPKIGFGWRGGITNRKRSYSYAGIDELGPLLSIEGVDFINIQYSYTQEELDEIKERYGVELHTWDDIDLKDDQDRLAALLSELDLVISPTTATLHLAGALGITSFIYLLRSVHTYNLGQNDVPWFKDQKIFAKENPPIEWTDTFNDIAAETRKLFNL